MFQWRSAPGRERRGGHRARGHRAADQHAVEPEGLFGPYDQSRKEQTTYNPRVKPQVSFSSSASHPEQRRKTPRRYWGVSAGEGLPDWTSGGAAQFSPLDMSLAESCRTNSGILSHWLSDRHRSSSVSSREPDFLAVILVNGVNRTKTLQEEGYFAWY